MKNSQLVEALMAQQTETVLTADKRAELLNEIMTCKRTCYGLGDEKHSDSVTKPGETLDKISNATDAQLIQAYYMFQIKINKLLRDQQDRTKSILGDKEPFKADLNALNACYYLKPELEAKHA